MHRVLSTLALFVSLTVSSASFAAPDALPTEKSHFLRGGLALSPGLFLRMTF